MANLLYKYYARARDLRKLEAIVGREGMGKSDRHLLDFADSFERDFVHQGMQRRTISDTLESGWRLLKQFTLQ